MLTASSDTLRIVQRELHKYAEMVIDENMSVIHIIGSLHWKRTQVESHIMDTIKDIPVSLISYGGSDHCFTLSVHTTDKNKLINSLSRQFFGNQCAAWPEKNTGEQIYPLPGIFSFHFYPYVLTFYYQQANKTSMTFIYKIHTIQNWKERRFHRIKQSIHFFVEYKFCSLLPANQQPMLYSLR